MLRSRKFLILVLDVVVSLILNFGAKLLDPSLFSDVNFLIVKIQPIFLAAIAAIAAKDAAAKRAGMFVNGNAANSIVQTMRLLWMGLAFRLLIIDTAVSCAIYFAGKYAGAAAADIKVIITTIEPAFLMLVGADVKEANAGMFSLPDPMDQLWQNQKKELADHLERWQSALLNRPE